MRLLSWTAYSTTKATWHWMSITPIPMDTQRSILPHLPCWVGVLPPRIRGLPKQRIYRIDKQKDYGPLAALVGRWDRTIRTDWISEQWDRMGQFYASLERGHVTASTALKRLAAYSGKNQFYRANRELGRIFKTEYILQFMSDPIMRRRIRCGLLKSEEIHALARQVAYGKQGALMARDLPAQRNTSNCLTLIATRQTE